MRKSQNNNLQLLPSPAGNSGHNSPHSGNLTPILVHVLGEVQRELGLQLGKQGAEAAVGQKQSIDRAQLVDDVAERIGLELTRFERDEILKFLEQDDRPFGVLQELVDDPEISDIIITNFAKIAVQQGRRNYTTGIRWPSAAAYEAFVERLLHRAGSVFSTKKPIADGSIGGFARIHAVHSALCESGPYVTIRLNRFASVTVEDLTKKGLAPSPILKYLEKTLIGGNTVMIVGEVGTGKTTLARALASAIPENESILVIEDTPEIKLTHPHVRYLTTREANIDGVGRVTPSECIRAGMRMAMNRIVFGEIRDAEAAEAFIDVCASGHPGLSTIHARSAAEALGRLELFLGRAQRGAGRDILSEQIATALQIVVFVNICPETGRRRVMEVREIGAVADGVVRQREIFKYRLQNGAPGWQIVNRVSSFREVLESGKDAVRLSALPAILELDAASEFCEAQN